MGTSDQQIFPWATIRYIRGCSDQNEVSRSPVSMERALSRHLL
jgi:hypothetical protein